MQKLNVHKTANLSKEHIDFLENNNINFSKYVRSKIEEDIKIQNETKKLK